MSIPDIASTRPTLAAWLAEYAAIEADYLASLRATGIDFAPRDDAEKRAALKDRLAHKGALPQRRCQHFRRPALVGLQGLRHRRGQPHLLPLARLQPELLLLLQRKPGRLREGSPSKGNLAR